jgi:outer membrane lipoprotein carrier protein
MRAHRRLLPPLLLALLAAAPAAGNDEPEPEPSACVRGAVAAIQRRYESVRDLSARFEQTSRSVALGNAGASTRSRGRVSFAKPGRMRWHYEEPEESLVVSDGRWLWLYDPARREAQKLPVGEAWLSGAAIQFLLGEGQILRDFRVSAELCGAQDARLTLVPRQPASYERILLRADPRSGEILETEVHDLLGNATRVAFSEVRVNTDPAAALFEFEAPPGVELLELEAPAQP